MKIICSLLLGLICSTAFADIPFKPTGDEELPAAITGQGGPLQGSDLRYFDSSPETVGYLAVPEGTEPRGAIILIHEWNGLVPRIRETADAFAAEGYVALAADLYKGRTGSNRDENMALVTASLANPDEIIANLEAAVTYLKGRDDVNGKVATVGWCYGGGVAMSFALGSATHDGTAIFYGRLVDDPEKLKHLHHEILGTFAENDRGPSPEQVISFVEALRAAGISNDIHIYDEVRHGFWLHVDRDPKTNAAPALDAWQRLKAYWKRTIAS